MAKSAEVAIIGGGIIGLTCAYFLARERLFTVEVYDRGDMGQEASWAGAGILPPGNPAGAASPIDRLRAIGATRFAEFSAELRNCTGFDNGYTRCGAIEFLDPLEAPEILELWDREGVAYECLNRGRVRALEPALVDLPAEPYHLPDCAQVRNPRHLRALIAACRQVGVTLRPHTPVDGIVPDPGQPRRAAIQTGGGVRSATRILITAGSWSQPFLAGAGERGPGVYPVRGQIVLLKQSERPLSRIVMHGKQYLVPRLDGHVLIGSTEEPEARYEKANTAHAVADLLAFATRLVPTLAAAELVKCWSGLRPATTDGMPFIGPVPEWENVSVATGHFRAGVQLSIGTAQAITELLTGKPTCVPLESFAVSRPPPAGKSAFRS